MRRVGLERSETAVGAALAFVLVGADDPEYEGRVRIRSTVLGLQPVGEPANRTGAPPREPGVTWKIVAPNGVTMALRARDFRDAEEARADIDRLTGRRGFRAVPVEDAATGRLSFWVVDGRRVVVVSLRLLPPTRRPMLRHEGRRVLEALRKGPQPVPEADTE
ncbi:hypothetical protein ABCS02_10015 [Microbacterium sp. X-17]|uniref:hypothetical protein n=1 Tax=Microbacterium sp. X-17 TaxID=3144404 RepID=UPI0031F50416